MKPFSPLLVIKKRSGRLEPAPAANLNVSAEIVGAA